MSAPISFLLKGLLFLILQCTAFHNAVQAQKYYTKNGNISFFSKTSIENIKADNNQVVSVLNIQNGELQFLVLVKNFHFKKALMEEHFNENYLESDQYPRALFKGTIKDITKISFTADGIYPVNVAGELTIHGVTRVIAAKGTITIKAGTINANSSFDVEPENFNITIPNVVRNNIANSINVTVNCLYDQHQ